MDQITIAKTFRISESLVSKIKHGKRFTEYVGLAIEIARLSGKKPIAHIRKDLRRYVLKERPYLNKKIPK